MLLEKPLLRSLNHVLGQAAWATEKLRPFAGRNARLNTPPFVLDFTVGEGGNLLGADATSIPDVEITLPASAPLLALQGNDRLIGAAHITGSADFADALGFVLRNLRWDIEEDLSKAVGDIAAHRIVGALDGLVTWQKQAALNLTENLGEYLTEERPVLVKTKDVTAFAADIEGLRGDLARLEKRIKLLD